MLVHVPQNDNTSNANGGGISLKKGNSADSESKENKEQKNGKSNKNQSNGKLKALF